MPLINQIAHYVADYITTMCFLQLYNFSEDRSGFACTYHEQLCIYMHLHVMFH